MDDRAARRTGYPLTIPDALLHSDAMRQACVTRNYGEVFRLVNRRTGSSYADMAAAIGKMTSSRVGDIIRGVRGVRGQGVIERVCDGFGIPGEMLGVPTRPWEPDRHDIIAALPQSETSDLDTGDLDEMIRRDFIRLMSMANVAVALPELTMGDSGQPLDAIGSHQRMNSHLWQVFGLATTKRTVYPVVQGQLAELVENMRRAVTGTKYKELCAAAGSLFQLAGEIHFDSNRYADATHSYSLAANASKEAGDYDLWACALTRQAFIGLYEREYGATVPLLQSAEHVAQRGDRQLATRHWVAAVQAEVFAKLGDYDSCRRALDRAGEVEALSGTVHNGGWLRFEGSRLAEERGACFVALGRADLAEAALTDALKQPLSARRRVGVLADLATLGIQQRDADMILEHTRSVIELYRQTKSGYVRRRLGSIQTRLTPVLADPRLSQLREEIAVVEGEVV
ncbi:transcriptional regulator [Streptomyces sp. NPDC049881]|uniref:transcriptional regulator n=1 Tax=Streptomyces sp. NPDC049881 TaxID=3155778 RepID=UPI00342497DE